MTADDVKYSIDRVRDPKAGSPVRDTYASVESVEVALSTGISADVVSPQFDPNGYWNLGSRCRKLDCFRDCFRVIPKAVLKIGTDRQISG